MPLGSINAKHAILLSIVFSTSAVASTDFQACFQQLQQGTWGLEGAVDFFGSPVSNLTQAVGLTYHACQIACGPGSEPFDWVIFSQKFTAWALPYLALILQLPYSTSADRLSNFEAIVMSVGSPMLAAYSLLLAVTSNRWMVRKLGQTKHRNTYFAAAVLGGLQQVSLCLAGDEHTLPSLIALRENDKFWHTLKHGLEYSTPRWNLPAVFSMIFIAISYIFTWVDTIRCDLNNEGSCSGSRFGSLWLSLIPIVLCNLQLSPKTDLNRILKTFTNAQRKSRVTINGSAQQVPHCDPLSIRAACLDPIDEDLLCPAPVFYYARIFEWFKVARKTRNAFEAPLPLALEMEKRSPMDSDPSQERDEWWDLLLIILRSVILAAFLQWGTIGAAILSHILSPTRGLSCWSGSYLLYSILGTIIWVLAFVSSILAHIYSTSKVSLSPFFAHLIRTLAISLRIAAKIIAGLNVVWVIMFTYFQFGKTYYNCFCDASVLGRGAENAYVILSFTAAQLAATTSYWTAGMIMAAGTAIVFIIAVNILRQSPEVLKTPDQDQEEQTQDGNSSYSQSPVDLFQPQLR